MKEISHDQQHFHFIVIQDGVTLYNYTDLLPTEPIKQYSAVACMVDGQEYRKTGSEVAQFFLKSHQDGGTPAHLVNGLFMSEIVYKCHLPCRIAPSMN